MFKLTILFEKLKLNICLSIFTDYGLGDEHPVNLNLISRHEFRNLLAEDATRLAADTPLFAWMAEQGLSSTFFFFFNMSNV